jgi:hypothetical protein
MESGLDPFQLHSLDPNLEIKYMLGVGIVSVLRWASQFPEWDIDIYYDL